jgi:hypothetical protein
MGQRSGVRVPTTRIYMITWRQKLGPADCPYVIRWVFDCGIFSIRLHHWLRSDDLRNFHDHGWDFISIVLWGHVFDKSPAGMRRRGWLSVTRFKAEHQHMVIVTQPAWTLLITGRERRTWGYWVGGRFRKRNKYFFEHGHHDPCSDDAKSHQ